MQPTTKRHDTHRPGRRAGARRATRASLAAGLLVGVGALLTACGSGSGASAAGASTVPLTIYAAEGYDTAEGAAFQKATGIPVKVDDNSTGPLITQIEAEKNNPKWDLFWVDGDEAFAALDNQHLLLRGWEPSVSWNRVGSSIVPKDESYIPTGVTMAGALVYNSQTVPTPPTSWSDLLSPQWAGKVGMNDPAVSGPTYPYVAGVMNELGGVSQGERFFTKLKQNGLHVYQTNTNTLQALETGQIDLATIQSSAGIGAGLKGNPNIKVAYLPPETVLPSVLGIDAKVSSRAQAEAKQFVDFVFSKKGQQVMQSGDPHGDSLFWPLIQGGTPLPALPALSSVPTQTLNAYTWGPREASINAWFTQNIVQ